ncbi:hypothetical protein HBA55_04435 [Pseudomaricurvus alkylphenolicus]|jgi:hypothetical protein|uniref:hypothetical protein n=1 Tax=Pseudomaricurvus alkylphenolicus TaxID=1306991 RepID=UPI0014208E08|nr:hypothetical protein [Pseudomaricurvus alkylphenolicus]NIB38819.1 hypothetical protein [Pseudomaricurvus alkylphenolicus]
MKTSTVNSNVDMRQQMESLLESYCAVLDEPEFCELDDLEDQLDAGQPECEVLPINRQAMVDNILHCLDDSRSGSKLSAEALLVGLCLPA